MNFRYIPALIYKKGSEINNLEIYSIEREILVRNFYPKLSTTIESLLFEKVSKDIQTDGSEKTYVSTIDIKVKYNIKEMPLKIKIVEQQRPSKRISYISTILIKRKYEANKLPFIKMSSSKIANKRSTSWKTSVSFDL